VTRAIGTIGAGVIGAGVAQSLAQAGHEVVLVDVSEDALARARREIATAVRMHRLFVPDAAPLDPAAVVGRIRFTRDCGELADAEFVIENVTERWSVKEPVYRQIDRVCGPDCIFAANTSCFPITRLAALTSRPARVIGLHFMNPVPLKRAVEMIPGHHTSAATIEAARALLATMGKEPIQVGDSPGFVSNRVLMLTINEAIFLVAEGVAAAETIDLLFKRCFEQRMGPLETADLIGLDTILDSLVALCESFGDPKYRPCPLLRQMVAAGLLGRKSGQGFYRHRAAGGRAEATAGGNHGP
jgi:3-hydroxybutyryl-CoA dehydrogenase